MSRSFVEPDTPRACRTAFRLVGIGLRRLARVHSQRDETHDRPRAAHTYKRTHTRARGWKFYACRVTRAISERENYSYAGRFIAYYKPAHARRARGKFFPEIRFFIPSPSWTVPRNPWTRRTYDRLGWKRGVGRIDGNRSGKQLERNCER